MRGLVEKPYLITIFLLGVLFFLVFDSISIPLLGEKGYRAVCGIGYCICVCYCPNAGDCWCEAWEEGWYYYCYSLCTDPEAEVCCWDPPPSDPDYPIKKCSKAK